MYVLYVYVHYCALPPEKIKIQKKTKKKAGMHPLLHRQSSHHHHIGTG